MISERNIKVLLYQIDPTGQNGWQTKYAAKRFETEKNFKARSTNQLRINREIELTFLSISSFSSCKRDEKSDFVVQVPN